MYPIETTSTSSQTPSVTPSGTTRSVPSTPATAVSTPRITTPSSGS